MIKRSYQKLSVHYQERGFLYAGYRGLKYSWFLARKFLLRGQAKPGNALCAGKLRVSFDTCGIKIYWDNRELTHNVGLNLAMFTLDSWTDSSCADWSILKIENGSMLIRNRLKYLPITLFWNLKVVNPSKVSCIIEMEAEEGIKIDKKRFLILLDNAYKKWISSGEEVLFADLDHKALLGKDHTHHNQITVPPFFANGRLPELVLNFSGKKERATTLAQRLDIKGNLTHILGIESGSEDRGIYYPCGRHELFSLDIDIADKKPKVLLLNLPWQKDGRWGVRAGSRWPHLKDDAEEGRYLPFPFFLAYATSLLRKHGIEAHIIDAIAQKIGKDKIADYIERIAPDLVVAETSTPSLNYDLKLLEKIANMGFKICLCGPDSNIRNAEFLKRYKFIDYVLIGEYEYVLLELVNSLSETSALKNVSGLIYREGEDVRVNPVAGLIDLDTLPWPAREDLEMDKYLDTPGGIPQPSVQMLASRGCPFGCKFCLWPQVMYHGNKYRVRNIIDVVDEMEYLVNKMGFKSVYFDDDTFNIGKERMLAFCDEIIRRGLEKTPWAIMARADLMDEEILVNMKKAGLAAVKYGVESASQELLDACGKKMDFKKTQVMIRLTQALGIKTHLTFTFGLPGETKETIQKTIDYALKTKVFSVQFSITTPFPGTKYFKELDDRKLIINKNWDDYDGNFKSVIKLDSLSAKDLESARAKACLEWAKLSCDETDLSTLKAKFDKTYKDNGLTTTLGKSFKYIRRNGLPYFVYKVRDHYLDILGVFNGRYAFKGPQTIQIDLTDNCNNNCLACWCNSPLLNSDRLNRPKHTLPTKLVMKLISEAAAMGLREIYFSGGGEPFMHPDILEIIEYAKGHKISCSVNTNFTLLDEKVIKRLIALKLDHLTVSVWAASPATYKALHPNKDENDFHRIRDMLKFLNTAKECHPDIKIYNVICNLNYREIKEMLNFARLTGSESLEFTVVDTMPGATDRLTLLPEHRKDILRKFEEIRQQACDRRDNHFPKIINLEHFLRRISDASADSAQYDSQFIDSMPCYIGWLFARIMPNGDVNSCLKSHRFPIGNIHSQKFSRIWNSDKQVYFRKKALRIRKDDPFFSLIGNDPECKIGCYKSCDDIGRNTDMHNRLKALSRFERTVLSLTAKSGLAKLILALDKK